jgi:hypothetical protein
MNDTTKIQSGAPAELTRTHNKNLIFAALADLGIHRVTIDYDGSGDSGQIDSIEAWNAANEKIPLPSIRKVYSWRRRTPAILSTPSAWRQRSRSSPGTIFMTITTAGRTTTAPSAPSSFDVPARTITLEHNERYTQLNTSTHEF